MTARRRVLVVDDSAFMRQLISELVGSTGEFEVVGTARDGLEALDQVRALNPDLLTLDVEMPRLDGLAALEQLMADMPRPVVMLSAGGADGGAEATLRALELGAIEFVLKPSGPISLDLDQVKDRLLEALRAASQVDLTRPAPRMREVPLVAPPAPISGHQPPRWLVCLAASTGGPAVLGELLARLPRLPDTALLIAQHMPARFTSSFAARLHGRSQLVVREATHREALLGGHAYVAPGGLHLLVDGPSSAPWASLDSGPLRHGVRPAADPLFQSVAELAGPAAIGVVLTGMGRDGADGLRRIRKAGGLALVQDPESAVIAGMPLAALEAAGADARVPVEGLAAGIMELVARLREDAARASA